MPGVVAGTLLTFIPAAGTYANVIRLLPPLVIDEDLLRDGLAVLDEALASVGA